MSKEKRIYAYPVGIFTKTKEEFIAEAEKLGLVWTVDGFIKGINNDEVNDQEYFFDTYEAEVFDSNVLVNKLELASELAHDSAAEEMLREGMITDEDGMWRLEQDSDEDGSGESYIYIPEAQIVFDKWYDYYLTKIEEITQ